MTMHVEYDDFGEYYESEDLIQIGQKAVIERRETVMRKLIRKIMLAMTVMALMFTTTSYASGTCAVKGCYRSSVYGGSYCSKHICSKYNCKNLAVDGGYCSEHQKKSYTGSTGSNFSSSVKRCVVFGCNNVRSGGSCYCSRHKCAKSGCTNKADASGYCGRHYSATKDPYDVYDYDDPEDFYFYWEDDFVDYEDAEDYWEDAWN